MVTRPLEVGEQACDLRDTLPRVSERAAEQVKPFALLMDRIGNEYTQFAVASSASPEEHLRVHLRLIEWYRERGQIIQAVTLAYEWLISFVAVKGGYDWRN